MTHTETVEVIDATHDESSMIQPEKMIVETEEFGEVKVANIETTGNPEVYEDVKSAWESGELDAVEVTVHKSNLSPDVYYTIRSVA